MCGVADPSSLFDSAPYPELFAKADEVRAHRDAFMDEVVAGNVDMEAVFERAANDPRLASMKVLGAIEGHPDLKKVQTRRAFEELGISEGAHVQDVTAEQIAALPAALEGHAR